MTSLFKLILIFTVIATVGTGNLVGQISPALQDSLQTILDESVPSQQGGGAILGVYIPGVGSWYGASGKSISGVTTSYPPVDALPTDHFRMASITKSFTAIALLMLQEQGSLNLDDQISMHLRSSLLQDTVPNGNTMSIRQLLNHTSGIGELALNDSCQQDALGNLTATYDLEQAVFCGSQVGSNFSPGASWEYSNTNYSLLAMIIESVSGMSYNTFIETNILTPHGLSNTYFPDSAEIQASHMGCYWWVLPFYLVDITIVDQSLYTGWANLVSTTEDVMLYYEKLRNGDIISSNSLNEMFSVSGSAVNYGLGIELKYMYGNNHYGHSGEVGNTSGWYFCDMTSDEAPSGYYMAYNFNYQGVNGRSEIDEPVYKLLSGMNSQISETESGVEVSIFPNPTSDVLFTRFSGEKIPEEMVVINTLGQEIYQIKMSSEKEQKIDISSLTPGWFGVQFNFQNGTHIYKQIVVSK